MLARRCRCAKGGSIGGNSMGGSGGSGGGRGGGRGGRRTGGGGSPAPTSPGVLLLLFGVDDGGSVVGGV